MVEHRERIVVVVGNPNRGGRTTQAGQAGAERLQGKRPDLDIALIELSDAASSLFDWGSENVKTPVAEVVAAEALASPTYKACFTGLLKAFLDWFGAGSLGGIPHRPGDARGFALHALAVELHLRPVLSEIGASMPSRGLYLLYSELGQTDGPLDRWWEESEQAMRAALVSGRGAPGNA